jgi:dUTP pyrophosphatase|tara:strand:+ start:5560 stop:6117 length:558 start_codon:yes stop_codon:yes gene_type:complete
MDRSYWGNLSITLDDDGEESMTFVDSCSANTTIKTIDMSKQLEVKFVKTHDDAVLPKANNTTDGTGDSGYDLTAVEAVDIPPKGSAVVPVGLKLGFVTPGFWFRIEPRSGLGFKSSIQPHLGVIDNGYRGDLGVKLYNFSDKVFSVKHGERIAQMVFYELLQPNIEWTEEADETARGEKGFGSSD